MDSYIHLPYLLFQLLLFLQDTLKYFAIFRESFAPAALQLLFRLNTPTNNSSHLSGIRSSPVDHMSHKILRMQFDLPKILCSLVLPKVLSACIMVKSICRAIFINILCHCHPEPIDSLCCDCSQSSVEPWNLTFLLIRHSRHELDIGQSCCNDCPPSSLQLECRIIQLFL